MRPFATSFLFVGLVAARADGAERQNQLFASWQEVQRGVKSLVVEFTLDTRDPIFEERQKGEGTFRLIRTRKGEVFASYEVTQVKAEGDKQERWSGLLSNGTVYLLNHDKKIAIRFEITDGKVRRFLEHHFNPFVRLLDQKHAEDKCQLRIVKQDERYTYLAVKPKQLKQFGWVPDTFHEGRAVLMNNASERVPKDMPRQLWYTDGFREYTFYIKNWRMNCAEAPKREEFVKPESRPGWEVFEWPFRSKKWPVDRGIMRFQSKAIETPA